MLIFDKWYQISVAALVPASVVAEHAKYVDYTASYRFIFSDRILELPGVRDVTDTLVLMSGY